MKLSDVMSAMQLATYAEIALVIFFLVFIGAVFHVFRRDKVEEYARARKLPLEPDPPSNSGEDR